MKLLDAIEGLNLLVGRVVSWLTLCLVLLTVWDVSNRWLASYFPDYISSSASVALLELEWHLFALIFLLPAAATFVADEHVRVDIFYSRASERKRALVDFLGTLFFLLPFTLLIIWTSVPWVSRSFGMLERSADPGGLPFRFILKAALPLGFALLGLQAIVVILRSGYRLFAKTPPIEEER